MYNETYEDYIRSILGYNNGYNMCNNNINENTYMPTYRQNNQTEEIERCYPEIYKIVYPMVCKKCDNYTGRITNETIEDMTDEIYFSLQNENEIGLNITLQNDVRSVETSNKSNNVKTNVNERTSEISRKKSENRSEDRQERRIIRDHSLRDLIKILLIRRFLNNIFNRPRPPQPPRPPFPGRPGQPGGNRPPFMPRSSYYLEQQMNFGNMQDIYEQ